MATSPDVAGRIWLDQVPGWSYYYDNGTTWTKWGLFAQCFEAVDSTFSWINQGTATITTNYGALILQTPAPVASGENLRVRITSSLGAAYTVITGFIPQLTPFNQTSCGIVFRESATNKTVFFRILFNSASSLTKTDRLISIDKFTNTTTYNSNYAQVSANVLKGPMNWLQMSDDGTNLYWSFSTDSVNYYQMFSVARNDWFTTGPDQIGYAVDSNTTAGGAGMTLFSWSAYLT